MDQQNTQQPTPPTPSPAPAPTAAPAPIPPKTKKSWLPFVIIGGVIIAIIAALLITYGVLRGNADAAAKKYNSAAVDFLKQYADKIDSSNSPSDAASATKSLQAPTLENVAMGDSFSGDYHKAKDEAKKVSDLTQKAQTTLQEYDVVQKYLKEYNSITGQLNAVSSDDPDGFSKTIALLDKDYQLAKDFNAPNELQSTKKTLLTAFSDEKTSMNGMQTAYNAHDKAALSDAASSWKAAIGAENAAIVDVRNYLKDYDASKISQPLTDEAGKL